MNAQQADQFKAPPGWEADLRSVHIGNKTELFYVLSRGKERQFIMENKALIVGTPEWIAAQKQRPIKYKICTDCGKRVNQETMVLVDGWVCADCSKQYR